MGGLLHLHESSRIRGCLTQHGPEMEVWELQKASDQPTWPEVEGVQAPVSSRCVSHSRLQKALVVGRLVARFITQQTSIIPGVVRLRTAYCPFSRGFSVG
jgi:hypothetical protein